MNSFWIDNFKNKHFESLDQNLKTDVCIIGGGITGISCGYYLSRAGLNVCILEKDKIMEKTSGHTYEDFKILIPVTHLGTTKQTKSVLRGMLGAEIDFIIIELDIVSNIGIASRKDAMLLRSEIELPKLKTNDNIRVRIMSVGIKHIIVEMYGKEVIIKAENLRHTYIVNCKDLYNSGEYLKVKIKKLDLENNIYELDAKCFLENPYKNIRKYITEYRRIYRKSNCIS